MGLALLGGAAQEQEEEWVEEAAWEQVAEQEEWAAPEREQGPAENAYVQNVEPRCPIRLGNSVPKQCALIAARPWSGSNCGG